MIATVTTGVGAAVGLMRTRARNPMRSINVLGMLLLLGMLAAACVDVPDPISPKLVQRPANTEWPVEACIGDCTASGDLHFTAETGFPAPPEAIVWQGEAAHEIGGPPICPEWLPPGEVNISVQDEYGYWVTATFNFGVVAPPTAGARGTDWKGEFIWCTYPVTGTTYSKDRKYVAYPGKVVVKSRTRLAVNIFGIEVYIGSVSFQKYTGEIYRDFNPPPQSSRRSQYGWAYRDTPNAINRSMPEFGDGDAAVGQWMTGGGCRAGWDIWVDGHHVCSSSTAM